MVAGDPACAVRVEHVGPVAQPQPGGFRPDPAPGRPETDRQHDAVARFAAVACRGEHGLERHGGQAQLAPHVVGVGLAVGQQLRLGAVRVPAAGRATSAVSAARRSGSAAVRVQPIPGDHLGLPGQGGQHPGVRGEQRSCSRPVRCTAAAASARQRHVQDGGAGCRVAGPARDRGGPAAGEHAPPVLAAGLGRCRRCGRCGHRRSSLSRDRGVGVGHRAARCRSWPAGRARVRRPGCRPRARAGRPPRPSSGTSRARAPRRRPPARRSGRTSRRRASRLRRSRCGRT